jgi:hypothetical protein
MYFSEIKKESFYKYNYNNYLVFAGASGLPDDTQAPGTVRVN